jgi:hypothetical protein
VVVCSLRPEALSLKGCRVYVTCTRVLGTVRHCICRELPAKVEINQFNRNKGPTRYSYSLRTLLAEHPKAHTNHF